MIHTGHNYKLLYIMNNNRINYQIWYTIEGHSRYEYMLVHIYGYPYNMIMTEIDLFKQLSDETRLRCILLLQNVAELCVCELTYALGLSQPKVSRHLAHLRQSGLVQDRRAGQWIYYRLHDDLPEWIQSLLKTTATSAHKSDPYRLDIATLKSMPNRPGASCCA